MSGRPPARIAFGQDLFDRVWRKGGTAAGLLLLCAVLAGPVAAQDAAPTNSAGPNPAAPNPAAPPAPPPSFATSGPFSFSGALTADLVGVPAGGVSQGVSVLTKTAASAAYDGNSANLPGVTAQATVQFIQGGHPGAHVGDIQGVDNIEAPNALRLYELWIAKQWSDGRLGVKLGLTDLNVDFDTQQVAALFLNSSDGVGGEFGHSGLNGPSIYPVTAVSISGFWKPDDAWTLRGGVLDGVAGSPDHPAAFLAVRSPGQAGLLVVAQAERNVSSGARVELGGWDYTAGFDALHGVDAQGNPFHLKRQRGLYGLIEGPLHVSDHASLAGWIRAGIGDPVLERLSAYVGMGLVASGLVPSRSEDQGGVAIHHAIVDDPSVMDPEPARKRAETDFEATYKLQIHDWLALQPDVQYVLRPNGDPRIPSALVFTLRVSIALTRNLARHIVPAP